jgi:hypothetical protein
MTLPALLFGFLLSSAYGATFHLWRGGNAGPLLLDLFLAWTGFTAGQVVGDWLGLTFARLGPLHLGLATIGSLLFLFIGHWLSQSPEKK